MPRHPPAPASPPRTMQRQPTRPKTEAATGGESGSKLTSSGSPQARNAAALTEGESETRERLYVRAAALGINGRSRMTKDTLRDAIARREAEEAGTPRRRTAR